MDLGDARCFSFLDLLIKQFLSPVVLPRAYVSMQQSYCQHIFQWSTISGLSRVGNIHGSR